MTNPIPPEHRPSRRKALGYKEFVGVFVAFATIGTILFWSLAHQDEGLNLPIAEFAPTSPEPPPIPTPSSEASPAAAPSASVPTPPTPAPVAPALPVPAPSASAPPAPAKPAGFSDVPNGYWAYPFITVLAQRGIISGFADGTFRPDRPVTRAEFAAMVQRAFDQPPSQGAEKYSDIPANFWAAPAIQEATITEFLSGYPEGDFRPAQQIPRVQALVALVSGLGLLPQSAPDEVLKTYQDTQQIPKWAPGQVAAATEAGLVVNYPDQRLLNPNQSATRAEVAAFIYQALVKAGQAERISSNYIVQP